MSPESVMNPPPPVRRSAAVVVFWIGFVALVLTRLALLPRFELYLDEAWYWVFAQHLAACYGAVPPMIAWLVWLSTRGGDGEFWVRLLPSLLGSGITLLLWGWTRRTAGARAALGAAALLLLVPIYWPAGLFAGIDIPLAFFWLMATWALDEALSRNRPRAWYVTGLALGLGMLTKFITVLYAAVLLVVLFFRPEGRAWLRRKEPWIGLAIFLALCTPVLVWNLTHQFHSVSYRIERHIGHDAGHDYQGTASHFFITQALAWNPVLLILAAWAIARDFRAGTARGDTSRLIRAVSAAVPFLFFLTLALTKTEVNAWYTAVAIPSAVISLVVLWREKLSAWPPAARVAIGAATITPAVVAATLGGWILFKGPEQLPLPHHLQVMARERMTYIPGENRMVGDIVRRQLSGLPPDSFVCTADGYFLASKLAYYAGVPQRLEILHPTALARDFLDWRHDRRGRQAVFVHQGDRRAFPLGLYFLSGRWLPPLRIEGGNGRSEYSLFVGEGFRGYETAVFNRFPEPEAANLARRLYRALLMREPDPAGLESSTAAIRKGDLAHLAWALEHSAEYRAGPATRSVDERIETSYGGMLGRQPTPLEAADAKRFLQWGSFWELALRAAGFAAR
jgi:hypothetical protein